MTKPTEDGMGQQSDLLKRLRAQGTVYVDDPVGNMMLEAADEIDRLRTENAKANQRAFAAGLVKDDNPVRESGYRDHPETIEELRYARATIERLRADVEWERGLKDALLPYQERAVKAEAQLAGIAQRPDPGFTHDELKSIEWALEEWVKHLVDSDARDQIRRLANRVSGMASTTRPCPNCGGSGLDTTREPGAIHPCGMCSKANPGGER